MTRIAPLAALLALTAAGALASGTDEAPVIMVETEVGPVPLRTLAEIDGDPATFTEAEREKYAVLAIVLGASPLATETATLAPADGQGS